MQPKAWPIKPIKQTAPKQPAQSKTKSNSNGTTFTTFLYIGFGNLYPLTFFYEVAQSFSTANHSTFTRGCLHPWDEGRGFVFRHCNCTTLFSICQHFFFDFFHFVGMHKKAGDFFKKLCKLHKDIKGVFGKINWSEARKPFPTTIPSPNLLFISKNVLLSHTPTHFHDFPSHFPLTPVPPFFYVYMYHSKTRPFTTPLLTKLKIFGTINWKLNERSP